MRKDVQLFLKFEDYTKKNSLKLVKSLIPLEPYWFWKEGDSIIDVNGNKSKEKYKYSTCDYMRDATYTSLEDEIYNMLDIFIPFEMQLIKLKKKYGFQITFTLHFDSKKDILPFVIEFKYFNFLSCINADFELV